MPIAIYRTARHYLLTECRIARREYKAAFHTDPLGRDFHRWYNAAKHLAGLRSAMAR